MYHITELASLVSCSWVYFSANDCRWRTSRVWARSGTFQVWPHWWPWVSAFLQSCRGENGSQGSLLVKQLHLNFIILHLAVFPVPQPQLWCNAIRHPTVVQCYTPPNRGTMLYTTQLWYNAIHHPTVVQCCIPSKAWWRWKIRLTVLTLGPRLNRTNELFRVSLMPKRGLGTRLA